MRKGRRWPAVLALLGLLWGMAGFLFWENCAIQVTQTEIASSALPPEFDGLRVAEIADLHGREFGKENRTLLKKLRQAAPDLICLDGDLFDEKTDLSMLEPLLRGLTAIAPTYYVTGNHEWQVKNLGKILEFMEALGVHVLANEYQVLRRGGAKLVVAGVHDPCGPYDMKQPDQLVSEIRAAEGEDVYLLLLAHRNDQMALWSGLGVQTVLAGHCHGGVVRLPWVGGVFGTGRELFPEFDGGLYRQGQTALYVSRGLGYSNVHFRLFNRPELAILTLNAIES